MEDVKTSSFTPVTGNLTHSHVLPENEAITLDVYNGTIKGRAGDFDIVSSTTYQNLAVQTNVDLTPTLGPLLPIPGIELPERQTISTKRLSQELARRPHERLRRQARVRGRPVPTRTRTASTPLPPLFPIVQATGAPFTALGPLFNAMLGTKYDQYSVFGNATWSGPRPPSTCWPACATRSFHAGLSARTTSSRCWWACPR